MLDETHKCCKQIKQILHKQGEQKHLQFFDDDRRVIKLVFKKSVKSHAIAAVLVCHRCSCSEKVK